MTISVFMSASSRNTRLEQVMQVNDANRGAGIEHEHLRLLLVVQRTQDLGCERFPRGGDGRSGHHLVDRLRLPTRREIAPQVAISDHAGEPAVRGRNAEDSESL